MTTWDGERWQAAAAELDALLELDADARETALSAILRRDAGLGADVAQLLANLRSAHAERFLEAGAPRSRPAQTEPAAPVAAAGGRLAAGTAFGGYRIQSVLGRGGMGIVYAAEAIESGRRVALKVLEQRFEDAGQRERFAREARLAASIDHPHCVFVFGADEVDGRPFIAMELMAGTLADRLAASGPLPTIAAADAALQLIAGLDAAAAAGILHRDVKPSNCFVDADGTVKIGDFGISRSTRANEPVTAATRGRISATPMYAPPEQLRGDVVDVRADIYSLGATLYELVTGRRPFDADDLMTLLMRVANDAPAPPHAIDPRIPRGLSDVILRCLAKRPDQRFAGYTALREALAPYGSTAPTPATIGRRLIAGVIDNAIVGAAQIGIALVIVATMPSLVRWGRLLTAILPTLLYFGLSESLFARSPGKAICGLRVVDAAGGRLAAHRAWLRALLFSLLWLAVGLGYRGLVSRPTDPLRMRVWFDVYHAGLYVAFAAAVFVVARRRNGFAGLHELATGSRVVSASQLPRAVPRSPESDAPAGRIVEHHGPFAVLDAPIAGLDGWRVGIDQRLRRRVWVRTLPPGTPPIPAARAAVIRPTRLRWLAGRRDAGAAWDVYDGGAGRSLRHACAGPRRWDEVRGWLLDLARELAAQDPADRPPLRLDRVWILDAGGAKLLDDPTHDTDDDAGSLSPAALLVEVAMLARRTAAAPWPVSASRCIDALDDDLDLAHIAARLTSLDGRDVVTPAWRALAVAGQLALPLALAGGPVLNALTQLVPSLEPPPFVAVQLLAFELKAAEQRRRHLSQDDRDALELLLAARYRADPGMARSVERHTDATLRDRVAAAVRRYPTDAGADAAVARPAVRAVLGIRPRPRLPAPFYFAMLFYDGLVTAALLALGTALVARTLLIRTLGFEIVTRDGPASRLRVTVRTAIAWAVVLLPAIPFALSSDWYTSIATHIGLVYAAIALQIAGALVAILSPSRGLQDRLAGTWIVPR